MSKKALSTGLIIIGLGVAAATGFMLNTGKSSKVLPYVPADTPIFIGNKEPENLQDLLEIMEAYGFSEANSQTLATMYADMAKEADSGEQAMFLGLFEAYYAFIAELQANQSFTAAFNVDYAIYMVEGMPVLRSALPAYHRLWESLDNMTLPDDIIVQNHNDFGAQYREYLTQNSNGFSLVIAETNQQLVVTINTPAADTEDLALTLGESLPERAITDSTRLQTLTDEFHYAPFNLMDIDIVAITDLLTGKTDNIAIQQAKLAFPDAQDDTTLDATCQSEIHDLIAQWPRLSAGYTTYSPKQSTGVITWHAAQGNTTPAQLQRLRGHVSPNYDSQDIVLGTALAVNIDNLTPVLTELWTSATQKEYGCEQLQEMTTNLQQANPMMLGMFTGMAQSLQGLSVSITELPEINDNEAFANAVDTLEGHVIVSTEQPQALAALGQFYPPLANLATLKNGETQPLELAPNITAFGALKGKDVIIAFGPNADANLSAMQDNNTLTPNGFLRFDFSMYEYMNTLINLSQSIDSDTINKASLKQMQTFMDMYQGHSSFSYDFSDEGTVTEIHYTP